MGASPAMGAHAVRLSIKPKSNPRMEIAVISLPNTVKARMSSPSIFQSPSAMRAERIRMGMRFLRSMTIGNPSTIPPSRMPKGMVTIPQRMPLAA